MTSYVGLGMMSGTSLDGLDLCCAEFTGDIDSDFWSYRILCAETLPYSEQWMCRLRDAPSLSGEALVRLHMEYGHYLGQVANQFITDNNLPVQFAASHGHTVFHQPAAGFTFQVGCGETLASHMEQPTVTNFRSKDVALGGQGAPLVPSGENYLFSQYYFCLNLGGIANISIEDKGFDICPCNMLLNYLARKHDPTLSFDAEGAIGMEGKVIPQLLEQLNCLPFYSQPAPKSLGKEWFDANILPLLDTKVRYSSNSRPSLMNTVPLYITILITIIASITPVMPCCMVVANPMPGLGSL